MGILNPKTRVMDVVLTPNGREHLSRGGLKIAYASLTDGQAYYDPSSISGSYDTATDRVYFESPGSITQDVFSLVTDDTGNLVPANAFGIEIDSDGTIYSGGTAVKGLVSGSDFSSAIDGITDLFKSSISYNNIVSSADPLDDTPDFVINPVQGTFYIDNSMTEDLAITSIDVADSLFFDRRFANQPQFKFLPPVVKSGGTERKLGVFRNLKRTDDFTYQDLQSFIFGTNANPIKQRLDIVVQDSSIDNDMVVQMFEVTPDGLTKLDAVDFGEVYDTKDKNRPQKRVVFFGKVFQDVTDTATYINLFTVVFD